MRPVEQGHTQEELLYQVATGGLNAGDITYGVCACTSKYDNAHFRRGVVTGLDTGQQMVHLDDGQHVGYDYLIVSSGVTANYFDVPGAAEYSLTICTPGSTLGSETAYSLTSRRSPAVQLPRGSS